MGSGRKRHKLVPGSILSPSCDPLGDTLGFSRVSLRIGIAVNKIVFLSCMRILFRRVAAVCWYGSAIVIRDRACFVFLFDHPC